MYHRTKMLDRSNGYLETIEGFILNDHLTCKEWWQGMTIFSDIIFIFVKDFQPDEGNKNG